MAYLSKKGAYWYICKSVKVGPKKYKTKWTPTGTMSKPLARIELLKHENGKKKNSSCRMLIKDLADEFNAWQQAVSDKKPYTIKQDWHHLRRVCSEFGEAYITEFDAEKFILWTKRLKLKPKTVRHYACSTRLMFRYAVEKDYIESNPAEKIKLPKLIPGPPKDIPREILWPLLKQLHRRHRAAPKIMVYTGLRKHECLGLKVKNILLEQMTIDLYPEQAKTADRGLIPINRKIVSTLKRKIKDKLPEDFLFPSPTGVGRQLDFKDSFASACKKLECKLQQKAKNELKKNWDKIKVSYSPHNLRNTFGTLLIEKIAEKGGDLNAANFRAVQQLMRHRRPEMTTRYVRVLDHRLRDAIDKL